MSKFHTILSTPQANNGKIDRYDTTIVFKQVGNKQILQSYTTTNFIGYYFIGLIILVLVAVAFKSEVKRSKLNKLHKKSSTKDFTKNEKLTTSNATSRYTLTLGTKVHKYNTNILSRPAVNPSMHKSQKMVSSPQAVKATILESDKTNKSKHVVNKEILKSYTNTNFVGYSFTGCIIFVLVVVAFKGAINRSKITKHRKRIYNYVNLGDVSLNFDEKSISCEYPRLNFQSTSVTSHKLQIENLSAACTFPRKEETTPEAMIEQSESTSAAQEAHETLITSDTTISYKPTFSTAIHEHHTNILSTQAAGTVMHKSLSTFSSTQVVRHGTPIPRYPTTFASTQVVSTAIRKYYTTVSSAQDVETKIPESHTTIVSKRIGNKDILKSPTTTTAIGYTFTGFIIFVVVVVLLKSWIKSSKLNERCQNIIYRRSRNYSEHYDPYDQVRWILNNHFSQALNEQSPSTVSASYEIALLLSRKKQLLTNTEELITPASNIAARMLDDTNCEKIDQFPLSKYTMTRRIEQLAVDVHSQ
ncbi:hypothetical protein RF11_07693 [Thelohanellus kitauei]|uniref:Uncharacterized protein n=1 Tax=Thelohanellus kitauei TaxID=669202 RepID=A0A0C2MJE6_THEKT|nr:hypothetical protein RF11_07693 [Thelohanellus kitauei]